MHAGARGIGQRLAHIGANGAPQGGLPQVRGVQRQVEIGAGAEPVVLGLAVVAAAAVFVGVRLRQAGRIALEG